MTPRRSGAVRPAVRRLSFRWTGPFLLSLLGLYAVLALETLARARRLCHRADTAWAEALDPARRREALERASAREADRWAAGRARAPGSRDILRLETDILQARHEIRSAESPAKLAFYNYRAVYRHAAPPESPWSRWARLRAPRYVFR